MDPMKKTPRWLLYPLLAVIAYLGLRSLRSDTAAQGDEPPDALFNRVWMEKLPDSTQEYVQGVFVLDQQPFGAFQRASSWDYHFELFEYDQDGAKLKVTFPQTNKKAAFSYTIKGCEVPPFDLCLTLTENPWGGPTKYYGFKDSDSESKAFPGARDRAKARILEGARSGR